MLDNSTIKLLRLPFSIFLSPLYFFALSQVNEINIVHAALIFIILHFLVYPASNGYNSYMDRDTGSIGGIEKPPQPLKQLFYITIVLDTLALVLSMFIHLLLPLFLLLYIGASKAYSYRRIRLKKYAVTGYLTVIIFQGALTFALVYFAGNENGLDNIPWQGMIISALLIGGFYPLTQIYQHKQDRDDGVTTISYKLGYSGSFIFCSVIYALAWFFMAQFFITTGQEDKLMAISIFFIPVLVYFIWWFVKVKKNTEAANFKNAMRMNWIAAICTNLGFITLLIWKCIE